MTTLTITAKGQVTLKQELLKHLGVSPGEKIEADKLPDGRIVVKAAVPEARIADFIGCLSQKGGPNLTITAKGQVTLKQELLKHLGVSPGEKIEADKLPDGRIVVRAAAPETRIADFIGCLSQKGGPKLTIDEMSEIATRGWAEIGRAH